MPPPPSLKMKARTLSSEGKMTIVEGEILVERERALTMTLGQ